MPARIQRSRAAGWRMPPHAMCVDRTSRWGNPFKVLALPSDDTNPAAYRVVDTGNRAAALREPTPYITLDRLGAHVMAVRLYELHTGPMGLYEWDNPAEFLAPLRGRDLACWCPPELPCHADFLLELANRGAA